MFIYVCWFYFPIESTVCFNKNSGKMGTLVFLNATLPPCVLNYVTLISIYQNVTIE
jgi:hypothetical protein